MNNYDLSSITDLLERQIKIHKELLDLSYKKRQVILQSDTGQLEEIVQNELRCLARVKSLEKKRAAVLSELADHLNTSADSLTLNMIIENAGDEDRIRLLSLQKELYAILQSHASINSDNQQLIQAHLEYTDTMLNMFVGSEDPLNNLYGTGGISDDDKKPRTGIYNWQV